MLTQEITYKNLDDREITKTFYFHLTKGDVYEINMLANLKLIADTSDPQRILPIFKKIVGRAYGERSDDGAEFIRTEAMAERFLGGLAFGQLFVMFIEDPVFASNFVNKIMPPGMEESIAKAMSNQANMPKSTEPVQGVSNETQQTIDADRARLEAYQKAREAESNTLPDAVTTEVTVIEPSAPIPPTPPTAYPEQ